MADRLGFTPVDALDDVAVLQLEGVRLRGAHNEQTVTRTEILAEALVEFHQLHISPATAAEAESKGSKFQGIRLDVNFRLPLNKMLQYKGLIKMIQ